MAQAAWFTRDIAPDVGAPINVNAVDRSLGSKDFQALFAGRPQASRGRAQDDRAVPAA